MSKRFWIIKEDNDEVTMEYMNVVRDAVCMNGNCCEIVEYNEALENSNKNDFFFVILSKTFLKLRLSGRKNIGIWLQGVVPEESFLKHNSKTRYLVLSLIEWYSLKNSKYTLYVSKEMKEYVDKKYKLSKYKNYSIMPCFNTKINKDAFFQQKYNNNIFCYAGGMSVWQEFDRVLECYKKIEMTCVKNCKLLLLVPDQEKALDKIREYQIQNFEIDYVAVDEVNERIKEAKYGFLFRKNHPVNNVATPTKFSTYLGNGIIPIFSDSLRDFYQHSLNMKYVIAVHNYEDCIDEINRFESVDESEIYNEYRTLFDQYYNRETYIKRINEKIKEVIEV